VGGVRAWRYPIRNKKNRYHFRERPKPWFMQLYSVECRSTVDRVGANGLLLVQPFLAFATGSQALYLGFVLDWSSVGVVTREELGGPPTLNMVCMPLGSVSGWVWAP